MMYGRKSLETPSPIRIYKDRWIEDDIAARYFKITKLKRERLSRREYRETLKWAKFNEGIRKTEPR